MFSLLKKTGILIYSKPVLKEALPLADKTNTYDVFLYASCFHGMEVTGVHYKHNR
jgi:hypothetical protein